MQQLNNCEPWKLENASNFESLGLTLVAYKKRVFSKILHWAIDLLRKSEQNLWQLLTCIYKEIWSSL